MPTNTSSGIMLSRFRNLHSCILPTALTSLLLFLFLGGSDQIHPPKTAASTPAESKLSAVPSASPGPAAPHTQSQPELHHLNQRVAAALGAFSQAKSQKISILSQSAADPAYNTPDKLLTYPGGAWEFNFYLDKTKRLFLYQEALDADELSILKMNNSLWYKPSGQGWEELLSTMNAKANTETGPKETKNATPGKGWRKVKNSQLSRIPYTYSRTASLEQYPFLYLWPYPKVIEQVGMTSLNGQEFYILKVKPQIFKTPQKAGTGDKISPDTPQELLLWVSSAGTPRIAKAVCFWVSHLPGGTLYTANQVSFDQS